MHEILRRLRKERHLTQQQVADYLGVELYVRLLRKRPQQAQY